MHRLKRENCYLWLNWRFSILTSVRHIAIWGVIGIYITTDGQFDYTFLLLTLWQDAVTDYDPIDTFRNYFSEKLRTMWDALSLLKVTKHFHSVENVSVFLGSMSVYFIRKDGFMMLCPWISSIIMSEPLSGLPWNLVVNTTSPKTTPALYSFKFPAVSNINMEGSLCQLVRWEEHCYRPYVGTQKICVVIEL